MIGAACAVATVGVVVAGYFVAVSDRRADPPVSAPAPTPAAAASGQMTRVAPGGGDPSLASAGDSPFGAAPLVVTPTAGSLVVGVTVTGRGGSVSSRDGRILCPGACTARYRSGETVILVARGSGFLGWSTCRHPEGQNCRITGTGTALPVARFRTVALTGPTSSGPTSSGPTSSGPTSSGPTSSGPTSSDSASSGSAPSSTGDATASGTSTGPSTSASPGTSATSSGTSSSSTARTSSPASWPTRSSTLATDRCVTEPVCGLAAATTTRPPPSGTSPTYSGAG